MSGFIKWLEDLDEKNTRVRAMLRRSLAFDPGKFVPAYPYVEPFVKDENNSWRREMYYLVAGLWAAHKRENHGNHSISLGKACAAYQAENGSANMERRFISLLDADPNQLPNRMRQIMSLLKEQNIDFDALLTGLIYWNDDQKRTQNIWARDFYQNTNLEKDVEFYPE